MKQNFILSLHPMTKFLFVFFVGISVFIIPHFGFAFAWFPVLALIALLAGNKAFKDFIGLTFKAFIILLLIVFLMQLFFYPGEHVLGEWWIFQWTQEGLLHGLSLSSKILAIGAAFILFFRVTEVKDFVKSLEDIGLPPMGAYVVLSTLTIIPEMKRQMNTIMEAQKTRGVETEGSLMVRAKAFVPTLTPLILSSIASTEERAITLESRAFSAPVKKTSLHKLTKSSADRILPIAFLIILVLLIVWRVMS